jgi:HlyD family secretion protein
VRDALRKHPGIASAAVLAAGLLIWGFWPEPVVVEAVAVKTGPLTITVEEEGRTRLMDRYVISAPVDGIAGRIKLDVGDSVRQGQVLLGIMPRQSEVLDPRSRARAQAQVAAAESSLRAAREQASAAAAAEELAAADLRRLRPLLEKGLVARDLFDKAVAQSLTTAAGRRSADFRIEVARYELEAARTALAHFTNSADGAAAGTGPAEQVPIRSPINGKVLKVMHEWEGPVRTGDPLLEVGDPSVLEVAVDVLSADAVKIAPGMKVLFEQWGGVAPLEGVVRVVEPVGFTKISALGVEEQRVWVICDFSSPPDRWRRLGDGYRVEARFVLWQENNVLQVPASALFRYKDGWALFVIENNRAQRREVTIGRRNGLTAQILQGVAAGEQVITHPSDEVEDGRRVRVR